MAVNVKLGVDIGGFTSGIKEGQQILKGLNAEMKASDAAFKATGNAEQKLNSQTKTLNSTLNVQKGIADQARQALQKMADAGVDPADTAYQKLYVTLMNAEAGASEAQAALNALGQGTAEAANGADRLTSGLNGISKKISLDQVISGIDKITTGLENAAKKAVQLGQQLWETIIDSARRADDTATMAQMYGIDLETFQRMQKLVAGGMDTTVDSMLSAQDRLKRGIGNGTKAVNEVLKSLHIRMTELQDTGGVILEFVPKEATQLFWEAGQAIMAMGDAYDKEAAAQTLFGRGWKELVPLFETYKTVEEYNKALEEQTVTTEESVRDLAELNDAVAKLESSWTTLKDQLIGAIAPALTDAATAVGGLLDKLTQYLQTDEGQAMLKNLGDSVSKLFDDLGEIDPESVVQNFTSVFETLVGGLQWIVDNKDTLIAALEAVVAGWATLKITGGALEVLKIINGLRDLASGTIVASAASGLGNVLKGAANIALKAVPWLAGFALLFENAMKPQGNDDLFDENGNVTELGKELGLTKEEAKDTLNQQKQIVDSWEAMQERTGLTGQQVNQLKNFWSFYKGMQKGQEGYTVENYNKSWENLQKAFEGQEDALRAYAAKMQELAGSEGGLEKPLDLSFFDIDKDGLKVPVVPEAKEGAAEALEAQIGELQLVAQVRLAGFTPRGDLNMPWISGKHANGLQFVPYDGYLAMLHRGERVMTARENKNYTYNNHNYFGNVNLNNGQDIDALCNSIDRHNRRAQSGFGS